MTPAAAVKVSGLSRFGDGVDQKPQSEGGCFYEGCVGGSGTPIADPPLLARHSDWPGGLPPPRRWRDTTVAAPAGVALFAEKGADPVGCARGGEELTVLAADGEWLRVRRAGREQWAAAEALRDALAAARLQTLQEQLEGLRSAPGAPLLKSPLAPPQPEQQPLQGQCYAERAPPMLEWLFALPAQWAAADLSDTFGNFQGWKYSSLRFIQLGGSQFHPCDIVCAAGWHLPRTGGLSTCCAAVNALEVVQRMRAAADRRFDPVDWPLFKQWVQGGRKREGVSAPAADGPAGEGLAGQGPAGEGPALPAVPAAGLARLPAHDAIEGVLACFLYTYNLQCPNDLNRMRFLDLPGEEGEHPGWELRGLRVAKVNEGSRAARGGVRAKDVIILLNGARLDCPADVEECAAVRSVGVVAARCEPRPLQLFGTVNWAMREFTKAVGTAVASLRRALAVFKPLIWRLDCFIDAMGGRSAVLFRGLRMVRTARQYAIGMSLVYPAFTSLSENAGVAWEFAGEDGGTWISVQARSALPVASMSQYPGEGELLLRSNTPLKVADKSADDIKAVLSTTNDAVSLVQREAADGGTAGRDVRAVLDQRIKGLAAQSVIFSTFNMTYVEPRVTRDGTAGEQSLSAAFRAFVDADADQWCVLIGAPGGGKSSALLHLYERGLQLCQSAERGALPLFLSLPLISGITADDGWLRRQVSAQLSLEEDAGAVWAELQRRRMLVFADSADECDADPSALRQRSLAARSGLPPGSKCTVSVRGEDMLRMGLTAADLGGDGCVVLRLLPFGDSERALLCDNIAKRAAVQAADALRQVQASAESRGHALRQIPGCRPDDAQLRALQDAALRGDTARLAQLQEEYAATVRDGTRHRLATLGPGVTESNLLYAMAAEAAGDLAEGADAGAVIGAALRRRMLRGATLVDPATWKAVNAISEGEQVDALMRVAEAVAAALVLEHKWTGRIGAAAAAAAPLCEVGRDSEAVLFALLPGLPLRTPSAEDSGSPFTLPHRHVHEWLATQWAERAPLHGLGATGVEVLRDLQFWAGAGVLVADAAPRVVAAELAAAERRMAQGAARAEAMQGAVRARLTALFAQGDKERAAVELGQLVGECSELYGVHELTASVLYWHGGCLCDLGEQAVMGDRSGGSAAEAQAHFREGAARLGRAAEQLGQLPGSDRKLMLSARRWQSFALVMLGELDEAERLLLTVRDIHSREYGAESKGVLQCNGNLAVLYDQRGEPAKALALHEEQLGWLESVHGRMHPKVLDVAHRMGLTLTKLARWDEARAMLERAHRGMVRTFPRGHPYACSAAMNYASALYRAGSADEAEALLREQGLLAKRQQEVARCREAQRAERERAGAEGYARFLRGGEPYGREWCARELPELLGEVDAQLRLADAGREPLSCAHPA
eukprot:TRINITY_DN2641_c1_g1_i4.p1 TRINITY_DN2641_c1_g1~~TRINITY_DN2641_c1_g1_i4.p1  ORF type:complete len:1646 (+),score=494.69 TRINITY_DN2641_c1_g1_i4:713-4939(+)